MVTDPLSSKFQEVDIDPLSRLLTAATKKEPIDESSSAITDTFEPWSSKKSVILSQYKTTKKISMTTAMNNTNEESIIDTSKGTLNRSVFPKMMRLFCLIHSNRFGNNSIRKSEKSFGTIRCIRSENIRCQNLDPRMIYLSGRRTNTKFKSTRIYQSY